MPYDAFSIDNSSIIQGGLDFEAGLLAQIHQFKSDPTDFIVSEIVVRETPKHLQASTKRARDTAISALFRAFVTDLLDDAARQAAIGALEDSRVVARKRLTSFFGGHRGRNRCREAVQHRRLGKSHFETAAPFEATGDKKSEFPDALALLSLQEWAR